MNLESLDVHAVLKEINESWSILILGNSLADLSLRPVGSKSTAKATEFKICGNNHLKKRHDRKALSCYTQSIAFAFKESEELAVAYANRSIVLLYLHEYVACLHDINRALETGKYPEHLRKKLLDRKERCVNEMRKECEKGIRAESHSIKSKEVAELQELMQYEVNPLIPNASSKIAIANDQDWGRYLVATGNIDPGEILSSQEYYALVLDQNLKYEHCSYCFKRNDALIPCSSCSQTMYCSRICREKAFGSYHRVECKMMQSPSMSNLTDGELLALRMLLIGTEQGNKLQSLKEKLTVQELLQAKNDPTNEPFINDYNSVLKLCRTFHPMMMLDESIKFFCCDMITILRNVGFFPVELSVSRNEMQQVGFLNETDIFVIMLLLNHIISIKSNNQFAISTNFPNPNDSIKSSTSNSMNLPLGRSVCVFNNLLNHSCYPNVLSLTRSRQRITFAIRPIKKREQIFCSYYGDFSTCPVEERRIVLPSSWGFTCQCEACHNQWPTSDGLKILEIEFLIEKQVAQEELWRMISSIKQRIAGMKNQLEILGIVCNISKWLHLNVKSPCLILAECEHILQYMMQSYDDFYKSNTINDNKQKLMEFLNYNSHQLFTTCTFE